MKASLIRLPFIVAMMTIIIFLIYSCNQTKSYDERNTTPSAIKVSKGINFVSPNGDIVANDRVTFEKKGAGNI